jgi:hypothetical protein
MDGFPRSQHRPVLLHYGTRVLLIESIRKPRRNFLLADWDSFAKEIDQVVQFIPASLESYERFSNAIQAAAKRHIPRGFREKYIPGWEQKCENLYQKYNANHDLTTAYRLLEELDQRTASR